ncbi:hypothetical protein VIBNISOn1_830024 [Vibrio nigripulchritudo SOn1]|uniref:Uncharacterized protein n=1 Tax=Vibrio nigripulchritudo SOn1 TaxID=1238450 RepID=A0AAV2VXI3_9VIBR|nr:hypothetical protein VIBNISOn1_830024 [Vibrio nigripulchritudo SOn1]
MQLVNYWLYVAQERLEKCAAFGVCRNLLLEDHTATSSERCL